MVTKIEQTNRGVAYGGKTYKIAKVFEGKSVRPAIVAENGLLVPYLGTNSKTVIVGNGHALSDKALSDYAKIANMTNDDFILLSTSPDALQADPTT